MRKAVAFSGCSGAPTSGGRPEEQVGATPCLSNSARLCAASTFSGFKSAISTTSSLCRAAVGTTRSAASRVHSAVHRLLCMPNRTIASLPERLFIARRSLGGWMVDANSRGRREAGDSR